jgi:deoxyadenosine/deoxycytidine kinase
MVGSLIERPPAQLTQRPLRVELVGPAGVGKSTLCRAMVERSRAGTSTIWGQPVLPLLQHGVWLLPSLWRFWRDSRSLLWSESRHVVRLKTLHQALRAEAGGTDKIVIFDEGPIFALAWLRGFGHETMRSESSEDWWAAAFAEWVEVMDAVVVLDAPDQLLATRIRNRPESHEVKQESDRDIALWMSRFRTALTWVLAGLSAQRPLPVLRLETQQESPERIADRLVSEIDRIAYGD